ncbi:MAG TPA: DoxX family protein [Terriglobales bacterium]|jgi:uncharacterized membrane protein YphA (DoxX/SURF4 family)|nr:DoxX family protein [Terriglobales bacterium]
MASATINTPYLDSNAARVSGKNRKAANITLWIVQGVLAALFVSTGAMKMFTPLAVLEQQAHMPGLFLRFIATCELLGALGLVLPGIFRARTYLTPLAASGLVIIMIGATIATVAAVSAAMATLPFVVGVLSGVVVYGRREFASNLISPECDRVN